MATEDYIVQPPPSTKIWRYLSYSKFESLINSEAIFFCQAKRFEDKYEGSMTLLDMGSINGTDLEVELRRMYDAPNAWRAYTAVNCWHINEHQSRAMWSLYIPDNQGIAIQSTVDRLAKSFEDLTQFGNHRSGSVSYSSLTDLQLGANFSSSELVFFRKRPEYAYEQEYRVIILSKDLNKIHLNGGLFVPVNLKTLIELIYIAPNEPNWKKEYIQNAVKHLNLTVEDSTFQTPPNY
jgi:hypothetical protein